MPRIGKSLPVVSLGDPSRQVISEFAAHVMEWDGCTRCDLHRTRKKIVFARGEVPCRVLFIGEAPGESENVIGQPFVGPAGQLLDRIIERALPEGTSYALTNLVCCIPRDDEGKKPNEPGVEHVDACSPRLTDFVRICDPELIVAVGSTARNWLDPKCRPHVEFHRTISAMEVIPEGYIKWGGITHTGGILREAKSYKQV